MKSCYNNFKHSVISNKRLIGCWVSLGSPISSEIVGLAGFDWLLFDGEHSPNDVLSFIPQLMSVGKSTSAPVVRPSWNDAVQIKRLLDIGFYNFLIPYIETKYDAIKAVKATRYPPDGIRGVAVSTRSNQYGSVEDYFTEINKNICVMVQIESEEGVKNIEEIASVDGVDLIFVGPNDLSANLGFFGQQDHPKFQAVIRHVFEVSKKCGKAVGILAPKEADARSYMAMGASLVAVGNDAGLLRAATLQLVDKFIK